MLGFRGGKSTFFWKNGDGEMWKMIVFFSMFSVQNLHLIKYIYNLSFHNTLHIFKKTRKKMLKYALKPTSFLTLIACIPVLVFAQSTMEATLAENASLVEAFSLLSPMTISPFWTLFITSFASTFGIGNQFIATNPVLGNGLVFFLSFLLVVITTLPNLMKVSKPIGLAAKFIENKAGYIIYVLVTIAPYLFLSGGSAQQGMVTFSLFDIPFSVVLIIALALPYFFVVMTVRYFLEILIFLSPIPLLDAFFELIKKGFTFLLILIYFFLPSFGFVLSILIFLLAYLFFKRATKVSNFFQYIYVEPILAKVLKRDQKLVSEQLPNKIKKQFSNISLAIKGLTGKPLGNISTKSIVWLIFNNDELFVCKTNFLRSPTIVPIERTNKEPFHISQDLYYQIISSNHPLFKLFLNSTYKNLKGDIQVILELEDAGKIGLAKQKEMINEQGKRGLDQLMSIFNSGQITDNKRTILED